MRILQIVADGNPGGGTTLVLSICRKLCLFGYDVALVSEMQSYAINSAQKTGIKTFEADFFSRRLNISTINNLKQIIKRCNPDIIHVHGARAALPICLIPHLKTPFVYTVHGYHFEKKYPFLKYLAKQVEKFISLKARKTIFVGEEDKVKSLKHHIIKNNSNKMCVIRNAIDFNNIPLSDKIDKKRIGYLGRLTFQKDPYLFVDIIKQLSDYGFRAIMVGGGDMEKKIREKIEALNLGNIIKVTGNLSHIDALKKISESSVLVMTSRWEGLPLAPLEAMHMKIPVIAPEIKGITEIITHEESGLLVNERKVENFVNEILRIEENPILRENIVINAKKRIENEFTLNRLINQHIEVYEELI